MRWRRLLAVTRKEAIQIRRDARSLAMAFAIPMLLIVMYGYALTLDVEDLRTIVFDQDGSAASRELLRSFTQSGYFTVVRAARAWSEVEGALDDGRAQVALVIPRNFARDLDLGRRVAVQALLDGSDANTATIATGYVEAVVARYSERLDVAGATVARPPAPVEARLRVWYNADLQSKNFIVPGLIAVIMMVIAAMLTSLTVAREWERGTMEQLVATPIRVGELVAGKLLPYFAIGMLDVALATVAATLLFGVPFRGSAVLLLGFSTVFLLGAVSLGLLISIKTRSQLLASQMAMLTTFLPSFLLSGFAYDIANMPRALQLVTYAIPARYFVTSLKAIFLKGVGLDVLWLEGLLLLAFAVGVTVLATRSFRKSLE
jgi:ABC-2 type transport system permease protein